VLYDPLDREHWKQLGYSDDANLCGR
jgi:hypothetical protein